MVIKGTLDAWDLADLAQLVAHLKDQAENLKVSKRRFSQVQSLFTNVFEGANATQEMLESMVSQLSYLENNFNLRELGLSTDDAQRISYAWASVATSTTLWMDAYNGQTVVTPTNFLDSKPSEAKSYEALHDRMNNVEMMISALLKHHSIDGFEG